MTQSVAITCAQIATIPKNSASEASVATSSTRVRPMSLTPISDLLDHLVGKPAGHRIFALRAHRRQVVCEREFDPTACLG
jgi:hypothetical protein